MRPDETQDHDAVYTLPHGAPAPGDTTKRTPPGHVLPLPAPPAPAAAPSDPLGPYRLLREIARGGMGVVHEAEHVQLRRRVALKVMRGGDAEEVERFLLEARAVARLRHPHVVAIHDVGHDGPRWFLAMDLVDGESLRRRVERDGPLAPEEAARATEDVARALHHAHGQGILHRDVKPHNVLVSREGHVALTDFGLAKDVEAAGDGITVTGQVMGTPAYMAPEQAAGDRARFDRRTDVWGAGAMLYELLTGAPPFGGGNVVNVLRQVLEDEPVAPRLKRPGLDRDLETICLRCLEKDPARRYDTAEELADDLARWRRHEPIRARRAGTWERAAKWARRHPLAVRALALVGLAGVLALGALAGAQAQVARQQAREQQEAERAYLTASREVQAHDRDRSVSQRQRLVTDRRALEAARRWAAAAPDDERAAQALTDAAMNYGDLARWANLWTEAEGAYELVEGREPRAARLVEWCRRAFLVEDYRSGDLALLTQASDGLVADFPEVGQSWLVRASARKVTERPGAARDALESVRLEPLNPNGWTVLANVYADPTDVLDVLQEGLARCPTWAGAWSYIAEACLRLGRPREARVAAERAVEEDATRPSAWTLRARARELLGDLQGACEDLERACALAPTFAAPAVRLAQVRHALGDLAGAARALDDLVTRAPELAEAWRERARFRAESGGDLTGALTDCDRALELDPHDAAARSFRASVLYRMERFAEAVEEAERATADAPLAAQGWLIRGLVRYRRGELAQARPDLERFLQLGPDHPQAEWVRELLRGE